MLEDMDWRSSLRDVVLEAKGTRICLQECEMGVE